MITHFTNDFSRELAAVLEPYNGEKANILLSGGSILSLFNNKSVSLINGNKWEIYLADERITENDFEKNITEIKTQLRDMGCHVNNLDKHTVIPEIDIAILSIGEDGHIASLFPNHKELNNLNEIVFIKDSPKEPKERISVGISVLNRCKRLIFMLPPKNGIIKNVYRPHESIENKLCRDFEVYLDKSVEKVFINK